MSRTQPFNGSGFEQALALALALAITIIISQYVHLYNIQDSIVFTLGIG
jgi:hypothetical protein